MVALTLVMIGTFFLFLSLHPILSMLNTLPSRQLRIYWKGLGGLVILFLFGYLLFAYQIWNYHIDEIHNHLVPAIFCCGGFFVLLVTHLSARTANDLNEIAILKRENISDPLLPIFNRRYFKERLEQELFKIKHHHRALSLLILDIDHFKKINDTFGHQKGDDVLISVAKFIQTASRQSDIIARYGGEEICIIAPKTNEREALQLAERIRTQIEHNVLSICMATQDEIKATVSIGVTTTHEGSISIEKMIEYADKALYMAKENGRNRVFHFNDTQRYML